MKKNTFINILIILLVIAILASAFFIVKISINDGKTQEKFEDPVNITVETENTDPTVPEITETVPEPTEDKSIPYDPCITVRNPETGENVRILPEYYGRYEMNSDIIGWIKIKDTPIDYPVMHTPGRKDFYLSRNWEKEQSSHGCIYMREACDPYKPSDNMTLYGHNMRDGSMFAALQNYRSESYWQSHSTFTFNTLREDRSYEIFATFVTSADEDKIFPFHLFVDATDEADYNEFVKGCKELAFYDTDITPKYGEKLICLCTCDYSVSNGRLVVVARQISADDHSGNAPYSFSGS